MWLGGAKCCSKEVHQHSLYPLWVLLSPLSRCEHSLQRYFLQPFPTGLATSTQIAPLLWYQGPALRRGRDGVESVSPLPRGSVAKLRRGALPLWPDFTVSPFIGPLSLSRRKHPVRERIGLSPSPQASTRYHSSQSSAECELAQETQELPQRYHDKQIKLVMRH